MKLRLAMFALLVGGIAAASALAGDAGSVRIPNFGWTAPSNAGHATTADSATTATTAATATNATHSVTADNATNATTAQTAQALGAGATVDASAITGGVCALGQIWDVGQRKCVALASANLGVGSCDAGLVLIGGKTAKQCCDTVSGGSGGNVASGGAGSFICKFTGLSCPSGWSSYLNWTTTLPTTGSVCTGTAGFPPYTYCTGYGYCTTSSHSFANQARESCTPSGTGFSGYDGSAYTVTGSPQPATISEIGCQ